ncbi:MAG: helix-turn-helix domain-containing protein [Candidatus Accumulibacter meliphilus]|uniref:Helix-turn-helix domain-containing protein n=1 Tax=Candidatus Accumulibacter meliphilus TaxID=2211374 RepID=A0A369XPW7_9PROT|nr:MAG: helix-turn-helix domain-containing protein [Candidatus Accumulibacter meliphilus]
MRALGLTQQEAAKRMGIPQPKVSGMMRGDFTNLSKRRLVTPLLALPPLGGLPAAALRRYAPQERRDRLRDLAFFGRATTA